MDAKHAVEKITCYRELLQRDVPSVTRRTLEWLLVNAVREFAELEAYELPDDVRAAPPLVTVANDAVTEAVRVMGSQFAIMQLYIATQDTLLQIAYRNFEPAFANQFAAFRPDGCTTCSRAVVSRRRVIVEDIEKDAPFARHVPVALSAGFRALQSTPLRNRFGLPIGVLTTHFAEPRRFSNDELIRFDAHVEHVSSELMRAWG